MLKDNRFSYWLTDKYIYVMLLIYPLFLGFRGYVHLTASKFVFFAVFTGLWIILLAVNIVKTRLSAVRPGTTRGFALAYLALCLLSTVFSVSILSSLAGEGRFDGLATIIMYVCIVLGVSTFGRPKRGYLAAAAAAVSVCCITAIVQLFGVDAFGFFPSGYNYYDGGYEYTGEYLSAIGNADLFAAYLCLFVPALAGYYISSERRQLWTLPVIALGVFCAFVCKVSAGKLALGATALVLPVIIITDGGRLRRALETAATVLIALFTAFCFNNTGNSESWSVRFELSKMGCVCLAAAVLCVLLSFILKNARFDKRYLRCFFGGAAVVIVAAGLVLVYNWKGDEGSIYELSQMLHGKVDESFGSSRIRIWRETLELFKDRPLTGGGPGTLSLRLDVQFSRYVEETGKTLKAFTDNAHNVYLGALVNTGILSLIAYVGMLISGIVAAIKKNSPLAVGIAAGLICYCIQDFFGLGLFIVAPFMLIFLGLAASKGEEKL